MTTEQLPLFGFVNPRGQLPAFVLPVFGTQSELWLQDSTGDGHVLRFFPCDISQETQVTAVSSQTWQKIGSPLLFAFQFQSQVIHFGSRLFLQKILRQNLSKLSES